MADSHEYSSWIEQARREQRVLREHGCHRAAERMQSGIDADYAERSRAMDREEREADHKRTYGRSSDMSDD